MSRKFKIEIPEDLAVEIEPILRVVRDALIEDGHPSDSASNAAMVGLLAVGARKIRDDDTSHEPEVWN